MNKGRCRHCICPEARQEVASEVIEYLENNGLLNMTPQGIAELKEKYTEGEI